MTELETFLEVDENKEETEHLPEANEPTDPSENSSTTSESGTKKKVKILPKKEDSTSKKKSKPIRHPNQNRQRSPDFSVQEGTAELEKITFKNPTGEKATWLLETEILRSNYVDLTRLGVTESRIATVSQIALDGGSDPYIDINSYSNAFSVLEVYRWNALALDTNDATVQQISQLYVNRIYEDGKFAMVVVGIPVSTDFEARLDRAEEYNDYQVVVVGSGFLDSNGTQYDGYLAAARVSGMIAGTPSSQSITRSAISGATDIMEHLTTSQYEAAIQAGLLTFSVSAANVVWVEQGINSLTVLEEDTDNGWKKIKRTKVRFELMQRLNDVVEPLVGKVNNDADGRMTVVQVSNGVCQSMVAEGIRACFGVL